MGHISFLYLFIILIWILLVYSLIFSFDITIYPIYSRLIIALNLISVRIEILEVAHLNIIVYVEIIDNSISLSKRFWLTQWWLTKDSSTLTNRTTSFHFRTIWPIYPSTFFLNIRGCNILKCIGLYYRWFWIYIVHMTLYWCRQYSSLLDLLLPL